MNAQDQLDAQLAAVANEFWAAIAAKKQAEAASKPASKPAIQQPVDRVLSEEAQARIAALQSRIASLEDCLPYADGQAYYDDQRYINDLYQQINIIRSEAA
jgi:hypothetical protein